MSDAFHSPPIDLGKGYSVEFQWQRDRFDAVWSPDMPYGKRARQLMPAYQRARHRFLTALADKLQIQIAVVDGSEDPTGGAHG
jgi:hypothetical protein